MSDAARDLRYARWLLERASSDLMATPNIRTAVHAARILLEQVGGLYGDAERAMFAQVTADADAQLDRWAERKASDR